MEEPNSVPIYTRAVSPSSFLPHLLTAGFWDEAAQQGSSNSNKAHLCDVSTEI
jgi:hypothetical protein